MFIILPHSAALRVYHKPFITYAVSLICIVIFYFQQNSAYSFTKGLMYYPNTLNPFTMITSSLSHADWMHIIGNLIFFLAFAPAVEVIIANKRRFVLILISLAFITSISYALSIFINGGRAIPTLGLSGIVMGMMGLSAYLLPHARIKVFVWFVFIARNFFIPAWMLAVWYIGWDTWDILSNADRGNTNLIAHVSGGIGGYLIGVFFLKDRCDEAREQLKDEMEYMRAVRAPGNFTTPYKGGQKKLAHRQYQREAEIDDGKYKQELWQYVDSHRDSDAIVHLLKDYDIRAESVEIYEELFHRIKQWGQSRTLFCAARLLIDLLIEKKHYVKALKVVEQCQKMTEIFVLANPLHVLFLAKMAKENHQYQVAYLLVHNSQSRYKGGINHQQCALLEIELLSQYLNNKPQAKARIQALMSTADNAFKQDLLKWEQLL